MNPEDRDAALAERVSAAIRDIPDFPKPGILFKDITPLLSDPALFHDVIERMAAAQHDTIDAVVAIESRGFIFGAPLALHFNAAFVPVRKPGKLPFKTQRVDYQLEYGSDSLEVHQDALVSGLRVLVVDDLLATGGTAAAAVELVRSMGARVVGASFLIELGFLGGRARLPSIPVDALVTF